MHEHSGEEVEWIEGLRLSQTSISLTVIENLARALVDPHPFEAYGRVQEVSSEALDLVVVLGLNRDTVVGGEPPGVERCGARTGASRSVGPRADPLP